MPILFGCRGVSIGFDRRRWVASVVVLALIVTACSSDVTQSEEYQALEAELSDLALSQAETERQLADVEGQLVSAEDQIQRVADQSNEAEERAEELESKVQELEERVDAQRSQDGPTVAEGAITIFGDGEISCPDHRVDDESLPVGTVEYQSDQGEIRVIVTLTDAAEDWTYGVEVWSDESCAFGEPLGIADDVLKTDESGSGELGFVVGGLESGTYSVNINISSGGDVPADPRHREMGTAQFTDVVVP